ncbi:hypothetical protein BKA66DRAFT_448046 [Pyrenochaeta sp. MPI-SDFR-AT-0127]|nr:hypothetical protein BKA66DRAFT_448046 [Pyrenochaeta sp. MPI-SDFR-AT-0127]
MSYRRSANTCAECRARKVKCDSRREICSPCERLHLRCSFERAGDEAHAIPDPEALLASRRTKAACKACQALKVRCSGDLPQCERCATKKTECVYPASKRNFARSRHPKAAAQSPSTTQGSGSQFSPHTSSDVNATPYIPITPNISIAPQIISLPPVPAELVAISSSLDGPMVTRMLEAFFRHIQPIPAYSYFHKASLLHRFEAGLLNSGLVLALIGTTCDMLEMGPSMREIGRDCLSKAETMVMKDIATPSAVKIQALILIIKAHCRQGQMTAAFVLLAVASRFAYALRLNHEAPKLCFLEQESRRRLMWSLFMIDTTLAGGIREFSLCEAESIYIQLPCPEHNFEFDIQQETESLKLKGNLSASDSLGSLGMYLRVLWLRYRILQTTKEAVLSQGEAIDQLPGKVEQLAAELTSLEASLPQGLRFSPRNLQLRAYSSRLCPYILIHIWLRQCYCDLYRVVLTGLKEALREDQIQRLDPSVVSDYRWKCYESAKELSNVLASAQTLKERSLTMEMDIQICAYQCVRLLLSCFRQHGRCLVHLTPDILHELINQCAAAVEAMPSTSPMGQRVEDDFRKLLRRGRSADTSPKRDNSPLEEAEMSSTPAIPAASHLFSRHSYIGQMVINDDSADLTLREGLNSEIQRPALSVGLQAETLAAHSGSEDDILAREPDPRGLPTTSNLTSFNAFQGDFGDFFDIDSTDLDLDLFGWSGGYWADTT